MRRRIAAIVFLLALVPVLRCPSAEPDSLALEYEPVRLEISVTDRGKGESYDVEVVTQHSAWDLARRVDGNAQLVTFVDRRAETVRYWDSGGEALFENYQPHGPAPEMAAMYPLYFQSFLSHMSDRAADPADAVDFGVQSEGADRIAVFTDLSGEHPYTPSMRVRLDEDNRPLQVEQWFEWQDGAMTLGMEYRIDGYVPDRPGIPTRVEFLHYFPPGEEYPQDHVIMEVVSARSFDPADLPGQLEAWTGTLVEQAPGRRAGRGGDESTSPETAAVSRASRPLHVAFWLVPLGAIALLGAAWLKFRK